MKKKMKKLTIMVSIVGLTVFTGCGNKVVNETKKESSEINVVKNEENSEGETGIAGTSIAETDSSEISSTETNGQETVVTEAETEPTTEKIGRAHV